MLDEAIEGIAEACEALGIPVVSGNVSLYNETSETPDPADARPSAAWACSTPRRMRSGAGSRPPATSCCCSAAGVPSLDGSEYQRTVHGRVEGRIAGPRPGRHAKLCSALADGARRGSCARPTTSPTAASRSPLAEARSAARAVMSSCPALAGRADVTLFGEGVAAGSSSCDGRRRGRAVARARRRPRRHRRPAGGDAIQIACDRRAHRRRRRPPPRPPMTADHPAGDGPTMCGVFGIYAPDATSPGSPSSRLYALQHRGQESAGIAVGDGRRITAQKEWAWSRRSSTRPASRPSAGDSRDRPHALLDHRLDALDNAQPVIAAPRRAAPWRSATTAT